MGMYDTITIKKPLPLPKEVSCLDIKWETIEYQTKSFDNCLSEYVIDENGNLFENVIEREYIAWTDEERKKQKPKAWQVFKDVVIKKQELVPQDKFHGTVRFYCYEQYDEEQDFYIDYDAYYSYGKLDKIEIADFKTFKVNRFSLEDFKKEQNKFNVKFFRYFKIYSGWNYFWGKIEKFFYFFIKILEKIRFFIIRKLL